MIFFVKQVKQGLAILRVGVDYVIFVSLQQVSQRHFGSPQQVAKSDYFGFTSATLSNQPQQSFLPAGRRARNDVGFKQRCRVAMMLYYGFLGHLNKTSLLKKGSRRLKITSSKSGDFAERRKLSTYFGVFNNKPNQPIFRPKASVKASFRLGVVKVLVNLMAINNSVIACHFSLALKLGVGFLTRQTS